MDDLPPFEIVYVDGHAKVVFDSPVCGYLLFLLQRFNLDWPQERLVNCQDYRTFVIEFSEFLNAFKGAL